MAERVLVLGGAGYIGSVLVAQLLAADRHVTVVDNRPDAQMIMLNGSLIRKDRREVAVHDYDVVIDLAGIVGDPACAAEPLKAIRENWDALRLMLAYGAIRRLVYVSSCSVYGQAGDVLDEDGPVVPVSLYGWTKLAAEQLIRESAVPAIILRLGTVYGQSPQMRYDVIVNLLTKRAVDHGAITIINGGQWRPFVHVADAAHAICLATELGSTGSTGSTLNVASQNMTIDDVAGLIKAVMPVCRVGHAGSPADRRDYRVSAERLRDATGWQPTHTVGSGIVEMVRGLH
jgi:nucleoside-diphosphate-sugar epimerase